MFSTGTVELDVALAVGSTGGIEPPQLVSNLEQARSLGIRHTGILQRCEYFFFGRPRYAWCMPRDAFPGYDEPVNIDGDPEDLLRSLLTPDTVEPEPDEIEPELDD